MTTSTRFPFAASRGALLALALALTAACGARGTGGSFLTTTDGGAASNTDRASTSPADVGTPVTPGTCNEVCRRLRAEPSCGADGAASCENNCERSIASGPPRCAANANALLACARTAAPMCSDAEFPFPSCSTQYSAYASCVIASATDAGTVTPPRDSGTSTSDPCATATNCASCTARSSCGWCANRCWTGSSSGPTGGSCGESSWAWTSGMCSSTPPPQDSGVSPTIPPACQSCVIESCSSQVPACVEDTACAACLARPTPACTENPRFAALFGCACETCEACSPVCGSF